METKEFNQCVDRLRRGDIAGLEQIYNSYYKKLTYTAFNEVNDYETAKDIASDFITALIEISKDLEYMRLVQKMCKPPKGNVRIILPEEVFYNAKKEKS